MSPSGTLTIALPMKPMSPSSRVLDAGLAARLEASVSGSGGDELEHAAQRVRAIERALRPAQHLDRARRRTCRNRRRAWRRWTGCRSRRTACRRHRWRRSSRPTPVLMPRRMSARLAGILLGEGEARHELRIIGEAASPAGARASRRRPPRPTAGRRSAPASRRCAVTMMTRPRRRVRRLRDRLAGPLVLGLRPSAPHNRDQEGRCRKRRATRKLIFGHPLVPPLVPGCCAAAAGPRPCDAQQAPEIAAEDERDVGVAVAAPDQLLGEVVDLARMVEAVGVDLVAEGVAALRRRALSCSYWSGGMSS